MGSVENRAGGYRAKYRDPLGRQRSETFTRKADVLPRFGAYRIGRLPADEIENWLNDEIAAGARLVEVRQRRTDRTVVHASFGAG